MTFSKSLRSAIVALALASTFAQAAAAGGEPKNEWPFTRPVGQRTTQAVVATARVNPPIQGEPKNEPPFTRPATAVVVVSGGHDFQWADTGIGAAAGIGIALSGLGALALARKSPRAA